jgi:phosphomannomutase
MERGAGGAASVSHARNFAMFRYTAMHGVGYPFIQAAFLSFGLPPPIPVMQQVQPDATFPTVKLPNPEEGAGALQLSFATAQERGARLVVASDPDADRFVFAELQDSGQWRVFNGNEIGLMYVPLHRALAS